jgi:hypothetical protein
VAEVELTQVVGVLEEQVDIEIHIQQKHQVVIQVVKQV